MLAAMLKFTLTNLGLNCPRSLLKTTPPPRVPMGNWGSGGDPRTQFQGFGARPSSLKTTRSQKPLKCSRI